MNTGINSISTAGAKNFSVMIESCNTKGYGGIHSLGVHPDTSKSLREKVGTVLEQLGLKIGNKRTLVNCSPIQSQHLDHFDLPAAISVYALFEDGRTKIPINKLVAVGEISLNGQLKAMRNCIPIILEALKSDAEAIIMPLKNRPEMELVRSLNEAFSHLKVFYFNHLKEVLLWIKEGVYNCPDQDPREQLSELLDAPNFDDMFLNKELSDLICTIILGNHNVFLTGTPGTGKSMLATRLISLLPQLNAEDHLTALQSYSNLDGELSKPLLAGIPPFRSPHHLSSAHAILGTPDFPGDLALAHGGILFLDELPEFRRDLLESLREPLETGHIQVSRAQKKVRWPCDALLVSAANGCPCGWSESRRRLCLCPQQKISAYKRKLSGPLMDRIDIQFRMKEPDPDESMEHFTINFPGQTEALKLKIKKGREWRENRLMKIPRNEASGFSLMEQCEVNTMEQSKILKLLNKKLPTRRAQKKVLFVARTIADLDLSTELSYCHVKQALKWQILEGSNP